MRFDVWGDGFIDRLRCFADGDPPEPAGTGAGGAGDSAGGDPPVAPATATPDPAAATAAPPATPPEPDPLEGWTPEAIQQQMKRQHRKIKDLEEANAKAREIEAENAELRRMVEAARARSAPATGTDPATPPASTDARPPPAPPPRPAAAAPAVDPVAAARRQIETEELAKKLETEYAKEWPIASRNLEMLNGVPPDVFGEILATDEPAFVLVELGKNPTKFQEIVALPQAKRQTALIKMAMARSAEPAPRPRPSDAPPPPSHLPSGGAAPPASANPDLYDDKLPDEDWYAKRDAEKRASKGRPWSYGGKAGAPH